MAILYFETQAKYDQLIQLKKKVDELRESLASLDMNITPKTSVSMLQKQLEEARKEMDALQRSAALAGEKMKNSYMNAKKMGNNIRGASAEGRALMESMKEVESSTEGIGKGVANFTKQFTAAALALEAIQGTIGAIKDGVGKIVDFEASNATLAAILGLDVNQLKDMTESAEKLGRTTVYTASQVTELQTALSKLGFTRNDILGMQEAILYFAQATGSALDDAASTTGAALRMFGVQAEDYQKEVGRYTGAMAAATMRSALDFRSISENLATFGPMAHSMNLQIEDTLALFGTLKNMGIEASTAMTSLRNIFTKVAQGKIEGMSKVKSLEDFVEGLKGLKDLDAGKGMKMIGPRGGTQFITLIQQADEILKLRDQIKEGASLDTTSSMGETMINNVAGSIKMLQSAWEGFVLAFQKSSVPLKGVIDIVTTGIQKATTFVTAGEGDLPLEKIQVLAGGILAAVSAMVAFKMEQKLIVKGNQEEMASIQALLAAKQGEIDKDLQLLVQRRVLTAEQAKSTMALREEARARLEVVEAELAKTNADINELNAIRTKAQAQMQANKTELEALAVKTQNLYYSTRHVDVKRMESLQTQNQTIAEQENNAALRMNTLLQNQNSLSIERDTIARVVNTEGTAAQTTAQLLWNKAIGAGKKALDILTMGMLTNPYMLLAAAIGLVVYALYDWATSASAAESAQKSLNKEMEEFAKQTDSNKSKTEQLRATLKDQTATTYQQIKAYQELINTYRNFAGLTKEQIANMSDEEFKFRINTENDQREREYLVKRIEALKELKKSYELISPSQRDAGNRWISNAFDYAFGSEQGVNAKTAAIENKYGIKFSELFDNTAAIASVDEYIKVVEASLSKTYEKLRQFDGDMYEANKKSVEYTMEEAKQLASYYKTAEGLSNRFKEQVATGGDVSFLLPTIDDVMSKIRKKIDALRKDLINQPLDANLQVKLEEYGKTYEDMEAYKRNLQLQMNKMPLIINGRIEFDYSLPSMGNFPALWSPKPNHSSSDFSIDTSNGEIEENKKAKENENAKAAKERKQQAEKLRSVTEKIAKERKEQAYKDEVEASQAEINAMKDSNEKSIKQIELNYRKQIHKIDEEYAKIKETYLNQEKDLWLARNKDATEGDWLKSKAFRSANASFRYSDDQKEKKRNSELEAQATRISSLMKLSADYAGEQEKKTNERKKLEESIASIEDILAKAKKGEVALEEKQNNVLQTRLKLMKLQQAQLTTDDFVDKFIKEFGSYQEKFDLLARDYQEKIDKARVNGNVAEEAYYKNKKENINNELAGEQLKEITSSPAFGAAMSDALISKDSLMALKKNMENMMASASNTMKLDEFEKYLGIYEKITVRLAEINPFEALNTAKKELKDAIKELEDAENEYSKVREQEVNVQQDLTLQIATKEKLLEDTKDASKKQEITKELTQLRLKLAQSTIKVRNSENAYNNAQATVANKTDQVTKASKSATSTLSGFGEAFKEVGGIIKGDVGDIMVQTGNMIGSAMSAIDVFEKASTSTAKGVAKTVETIQEALAILQIIQIAWQLMQTIVGFFDDSEKKYQEKINNLEGQINALEYAFGNLKETMDGTWGLEAISAYEDAMKNLGNQLSLNKELISSKLSKSSSSIFGGYHSLGKKINDQVSKGLWQSLTRALNAGGFEGTISGIQDLLNLSPEALKYLMSQQEWVKLAGIINSQENKAYKGSDLLEDLKKLADAGNDAEDVIDSLNEKLNGVTFDSLKEEFKSLVQAVDTSINDITKSWDDFMRNAIYNQIASDYEKSLKEFYDRLAELNKLRNEGKMTDEEYRAALAKLKAEYTQSIRDARNDYEQGLVEAGVNRKDAEQSATQGGFETMSEDTGSKLDGRFAALQATGAASLENDIASYKKMNTSLDIIVAEMGNVTQIADESRTIIANSYLELQGIRENTEMVIKPIKYMANNIKELRDKLV